MLRSLLAVLAVLVAGLAFLFGRPWLYVATGAILAGALGLLGWWLWTTYQAPPPDRPRPQPDPNESNSSLDELGIVDIQPEEADDGAAEASPSDESTAAPDAARDRTSGSSSARPNPATQPPPAARDETNGHPAETEPDAPSDTPSDTTVFGPLLQALRTALDAQTVCLLVQEDVALTYRIEALASTHDAVRRSGTFDTQTPLVTATMSRESVVLRRLAQDEIAIEDLGYYTDPPAVDHLAVAPVAQPDASSTTFLLADAPSSSDLASSRARSVLTHFADTIAFLIDAERVPPTPATDAEVAADDGADRDSPPLTTEVDDEGGEGPRPRRELIAEEMEAVQATDDELALALVHLNRAESIARRGAEAVTSAERLFHARLDQMAPRQRIERFGELTYGVFFHEGTDAVEPWVADLESSMAQEQGELEGGVSVGVAVWDEETPEALRSEATKALREAYETGTSTIVT